MPEISHYVLTPVCEPAEGEFVVVNASVGVCQLCGNVATGMGGSAADVCKDCGEFVMTGAARGCIIKEKP